VASSASCPEIKTERWTRLKVALAGRLARALEQ
jgi:hypothetical protein